jgi:superfamily II DNA helicase RecQ
MVLAGSKASKLKSQNLNKLGSYGSFAHMTNTDILDAIDTLVAQGQLKVIPGPYPKLVATNAK